MTRMGLKTVIRKTAEAIFQSRWYPNKKILIESIPDRACQSEPVFQYMLKEGLNKKYKLIWLVNDKSQYKDVHIKNVKFVNFTPKTKWEKITRMYRLCTSRAMLYTNRYIGKMFEKQVLVYLIHGTALKARSTHARKDAINECDICISLAEFLIPLEAAESDGIAEERFAVTGYPRNDVLFEGTDYIKVLYPDMAYDKVILWMPTFRKADNADRVDSTFTMPLEIPCLYTAEDCKKLDAVLRERNVLLILKPHPAQKLSAIKGLGLTNIVLLYNDELEAKGVQLYQFIGSTDALITDYSSIYYDYLLTGNPIGLTVDDFEVYSQETGFVYDNVFDYIIGEHILNVEDFISFAQHVANGEDPLKEKRTEITALFHRYQDDQSTKRVYDCVMHELHNRYG